MKNTYCPDDDDLRVLEKASELLTELMSKNPEHVKSEASTSLSVTIQDFQNFYRCSEATIDVELGRGKLFLLKPLF